MGKALASNPDDLRSILGTCMVGGENLLPQVALWLPYVSTHVIPHVIFFSPSSLSPLTIHTAGETQVAIGYSLHLTLSTL